MALSTVRRFRMTINGKVYEVEAEEIKEGGAGEGNEHAPVPSLAEPTHTHQPRMDESPSQAVSASALEAPLPGLVLDVKVSVGQGVQAGQVIVILEAMKMENEIVASQDAVVSSVLVSKGDSVSAGDVLVVFE